MGADDRNRLTFGEGPLDRDFDDLDTGIAADASPRRNRAAIYAAVAMGALVLLGLLALVIAVTVWLPAQRESRMASATSTAQVFTRVAAAWTATPTPTSTPMPLTATPTNTPVATETPTRVVIYQSMADQQATQTPPPVQLPTTTPDAGLGVGGMAALAAGLVGLLFVARLLRGQG